MSLVSPQFAESSSSGISSLGINLKSFIFQLITFLIVLLILRRWVYPKLVATLEERRKTLEESLTQAKQTEEALARAEAQAGELLRKARAEADAALADANTRVEEIIAKGEETASVKAARIIKDAEEHLDKERQRLHNDLRQELAELVASATEKVLQKKLDEREDRALIERSLREIG